MKALPRTGARSTFSSEFHFAAGFDRDDEDSGDGDDGLAPDQNTGFDDDDSNSKGSRHRSQRGKGYGCGRLPDS